MLAHKVRKWVSAEYSIPLLCMFNANRVDQCPC